MHLPSTCQTESLLAPVKDELVMQWLLDLTQQLREFERRKEEKEERREGGEEREGRREGGEEREGVTLVDTCTCMCNYMYV